MIDQPNQVVPRVVALAAVGTGNEAAEVHSLAIVILGDGKACAATARDQEHAELLLGFRFFLLLLGRVSLHDRNSELP